MSDLGRGRGFEYMHLLPVRLVQEYALKLCRGRENKTVRVQETRTLRGWYLDGIPIHQNYGRLADAIAIEEGAIC